MRCDQYRESASARLDGEAPPVGDAALDAHLAGCAECAGWYAAANRLPGLVLAARAEPVPDLSAAVLAAALPPGRPRWRVPAPSGGAPTHVLVWCAAALIAALLWVRRPDPALAGRTGTAA